MPCPVASSPQTIKNINGLTSLPYFRVKLSCVCLIVKLREREGQGVDPGRSLKGHLWMVDDGWWMVDILSLMLYIKFG